MITKNCSFTFQTLPAISYDGTYDEDDIVEVSMLGEFTEVKKINPNNPASQYTDITLGINYNAIINKDKTRIILSDRVFKIIDIAHSTVINKKWRVLSLQEIFEDDSEK